MAIGSRDRLRCQAGNNGAGFEEVFWFPLLKANFPASCVIYVDRVRQFI
jgi:hypothetical protein